MARNLTLSRWRTAAVAGLILLGGIWLCERRLPDDPLYRGKPLSVWLQSYDPASPRGPGSREWDDADEAVTHIGTNSIPLLLSWLRQSDDSGFRKLINFARRRRLLRGGFVPAATRNYEASMAFLILGDRAKEAAPALMEIYAENLSDASRRAIEDSLGRIGPAAESAVPLLMQSATNSDARLRANALWALGEIHARPQLCVPQLTRSLNDPDGWTQISAIHALGMFGVNAQAAIPSLAALTNSAISVTNPVFSPGLWLEARKALERIDGHGNADAFSLEPWNPEPVP